MQRSILALSALTACFATHDMSAADSASRATNARLKGDFAFVSSEQCVHAAAFGPAPMLQPLGVTAQEASTLQGTVSFDGAGGGRLVGRLASILTTATAPPGHQSDLRCTISYELGSDGSFSMERHCKATPRRGAGSVGVRPMEFGPVRVTGRLHGDTITAADTEMAVETVTSFWGAKTPRLCHRTWSATKIAAP
jgi:hypothetical protein